VRSSRVRAIPQAGDEQLWSHTTADNATAADRPMREEKKKVIFASSLGTVFEWYDLCLYGSLPAIIVKQFFGARPVRHHAGR
jgi:hypothetical protein